MPKTTRSFRLLTVAAAAASWLLVAVGGVVRAAEAGLGCPDWPLCEGRAIPATEKTPLLEFSHRATALVVSALVLLVAIAAWRSYRSRRDIVLPALVAAGFVPVQAVLGAVVVWLELPGWMVGVHFVVGMVFLAATVTAATAAHRSERPVATRGFTTLTRWTVAAASALVVAGALVVSAGAGKACGSEWPLCNGAFAAGGKDAAIQVVHRLLAYLVAALAVVLAHQALRGRGPRPLGFTPLLAVAVQLSFGVALVVAGGGRTHGPLEALHVAGAGAVWAVVVALAVACRGSTAPALPHAGIVTPARGT